MSKVEKTVEKYVVAQFNPWIKCYFPLFLGMVMYDNEFKTKENKFQSKDKIELQHISISYVWKLSAD